METNFDGAPWFWKLFGGTMIGLIGVLLMVILNNFSGNMNTVRNEIMMTKSEMESQLTRLKDEITALTVKISALEEFKASAKEKTNSLEGALQERTKFSESNVALMREHDKEHDAQITTLRERVLRLEEKLQNEKNEKAKQTAGK